MTQMGENDQFLQFLSIKVSIPWVTMSVICEKQRKKLPKQSWTALNEYEKTAKKICLTMPSLLFESMDTTNYFRAQRGRHQFFFNVASGTVYYDLFLFIRKKKKKKRKRNTS